VRSAREVQQRYWQLGKQALRLGDREQFEHLAVAVLRTREVVNRWERYLLQLETLGVRRDEVAATGDFLKSISAMTNSMLRGATPEQVAEVQVKMTRAVEKSEALEEVLSVAMEASTVSLFGARDLDHQKLGDLAHQMGTEVAADDASGEGGRIVGGVRRIEEEMRREP
jgi:hypothetical protein